MTFGELDQRARAIGAWLQDEVGPGERALLLYPPGTEFACALFGCFYAGVVAVPAPLPDPARLKRTLPRVESILREADPAAVLTTSASAPVAEAIRAAAPGKLRWLMTEKVDLDLAQAWREVDVGGDALAYLQFTSGSTSAPKGVMASHGNLLHNCHALQSAWDYMPESVAVIWVPNFHDDGLVHGTVLPVYSGHSCVLMPPLAVVQKPERWLSAISRYRATHSGGPNFIYSLAARKVRPEACKDLDLSTWRMAYNAAEPVRHETLVSFHRRFARYGFRWDSFYPSYGLAETTLLVSTKKKDREPGLANVGTASLERGRAVESFGEGAGVRTLVSSGRPVADTTVVIADPGSGRRCADDEVGEIWVSNPSVARGYWRRREETRETFGAAFEGEDGAFLRTGDLGFLRDGELFVTGRWKDLIIIRGRNVYPQDVELTVEKSHPLLRPGCSAAFSTEVDGEERLTVAAEVDRGFREPDLEDVVGALRQAVMEEHELSPHAVVLLEPGSIPKTSSGKIQRRACREAFLERTLNAVGAWTANGPEGLEPRPVSGSVLPAGGPASGWERPGRERLGASLRRLLARVLEIPEDAVAPDRALHWYGIDSLKDAELTNRVRADLGLEVPAGSFLRARSLDDLADQLAGLDRCGLRVPVRARAPGDRPPASFAQQRLWFLDRLNPGNAFYNLPVTFLLRGALQLAVLERAMNEIVRRHEALRTTFAEADGEPVQVIHEPAALPLARVDLTALAGERRKAEARRVERDAVAFPFDLTAGPLVRALVVRSAAGPSAEHLLLLILHHTVFDGWSVGVLQRELAALYAAFAAGRLSPLPELEVQYADFAVWQRERLRGPMLDAQLAFWKELLGGDPPALELPADRPRPAVQRFRGATWPVKLGAGLVEALRSLSREEGATLAMTLLSGFFALLHRATGQETVLVGSPTAGRVAREVEDLIGFFVNNLTLAGDLSGRPSGRELLGRVRETALAAYSHQDLPFERLVEELGLQGDLSRNPLFQVVFAFQNAPAAVAVDGLELRPVLGSDLSTRFDVELHLWQTADGLAGFCAYDRDLFDATTAARLALHYRTLLAALTANPDDALADLEWLTAAERQQVCVEWSGRRSRYPRDASLPELWAVLLDEYGESVALAGAVSGDEVRTHLSRAELDARANRLARHLRALGTPPETAVGLCLEASAEMVVAMLAVVKAGGAYVPLDPGFPEERLRFMQEETRMPVVLTRRRLRGRLPASWGAGGGLRVVALEEDPPAGPAFPCPAPGPDSLAYVLFTSGSTGRPKGIGVSHRAIVRLVLGTDYVQLAPSDRVAQASNPGFDAATFEIWGALLCGACLVMVPKDTAISPWELAAELAGQRVSALFLTTALFNQVVREEPDAVAGVDHLLFGGEAASPERVRRLLECRGPKRLLHVYGPTESTTFATWHPVRSLPASAPAVPIGRPLVNTRVAVVDAGQRPLPAGVPGELLIGGDGLARGYFGRPGLTAERFVPGDHGRWYRTGDLARYLGDGVIEFLGRLDHQVKVRGFRIEPGEIEAALAGLAAVREAVVVARDDGADRRLVAYLTCSHGERLSVPEVRHELGRRLPDYMVPAAWVVLEALPLLPSGKVDRRALPAPGDPAPRRRTASRTPTEEFLAEIWCEVLGLEQVGVEESFFELGGHSLLATRVISRVRQRLGAELSLRELFSAPTAAALARHVEAARRTAAPPLVRRTGDGEPPLSLAQERLWFLHQLEPESAFYNVPAMLPMTGTLSVEALRLAFEEIVRRHEVLRTRFVSRQGRPVQVIAAPSPRPLPLVDLRGVEGAGLTRLLRRAAAQPFDLERDSPVRTTLFRLGDREHVLLLVLHHIVSDGWSLGILAGELERLYTAFRRVPRVPAGLPELHVQFADFAVWQRRFLSGPVLETQLRHWVSRLAGAPPLALPADRPRPRARRYRGEVRPFTLPQTLAAGLRRLSRREGSTLFMTLLAVFQVLLGRSSGQTDVSVGTPIANRGVREVEDLVGFFVNTLVLRSEVAPELELRELLSRVREEALAAYAHQDLPFEHLVDELQVERDLSQAPLVQVMFALQNAFSGELRLPDLAVRLEAVDTGTAKFDLTVSLSEDEDGLAGTVEYSTELFDATTVVRMVKRFEVLLAAVAAASGETRLAELPWFGAAERHQALAEWNDTARAGPEDLVAELFSRRAAERPDAAAVAHRDPDAPDCAWSYGELDRRSSRLSRCLRRLGVGPEVPVGVLTGQGPEMVLALLGIFKAGGVYVPLDPSYPADRLGYMLADARLDLVLARRELTGRLPDPAVRWVDLDGDWEGLGGDDDGRPRPAAAGNLAYLIYTSGSTGRPKGVAVTQGSFANLSRSQTKLLGLGPRHRVLQFSSPSFDASMSEMALALTSGAALYTAPREALMPGPPLASLLEEGGVTTASLTPSALAALERRELPRLSALIVGGEAVAPELARLWSSPGRCRFYNGYGPTESTVCTTMELFTGGGRLPIGRPVDNLRVHVVDAGLRPLPAGIPGELVAGGAGVVRGYYGRPALTAERFVPDSAAGAPGGRLYRTGDLARHLPDGRLEFLGRTDHQVKVRGFRIELGEIEALLTRHPAVREACIVAPEVRSRDRMLVAYVVAPPGSGKTLREYLKTKLPDYMVPALSVELEALPRLPNGKVDRAALGRAAAERPGPAQAAERLPRTPVEQGLAAAWREVLALERVGIDDDFFALGGHSLLATQVVSRVRDAFRVDLPVRALFETPTVAGLARQVETLLGAGGASSQPLLPAARTAPFRPPLSFAQQRLWFLERLVPGNAFYNVPAALRLSGPLDDAALERTLNEIARRHETLRTTFAVVDGEPVQAIHEPAPRALPLVDLTALGPRAREAEAGRLAREEAGRPFDLTAGPLWRFALLRLAEGAPRRHVLLLTQHHILFDGWSAGVLQRELAALYDAFAAGRPSPLPELAVQYADFAVWQRRRLRGEALAAELAWWKRELGADLPPLGLPTDRPRPAVQAFRGAAQPILLGAGLAEGLHGLGRGRGATLAMTLLAGFYALLHRMTGQERIVVGSPVANRTVSEIEDLIGFFVNSLTLVGDLSGRPPFRELLGRVRETSVAAYSHQELPFEKLVEELGLARDLSRNPLFQVMFALQNAPEEVLELSELELRLLFSGTPSTRFDLELHLWESGGELAGACVFDQDLFDATTVSRMIAHYRILLAGAGADPERPVDRLPWWSAAEGHQVAAEWNDRRRGAPAEPSLGELFEAQAARTPDAVALSCEGRQASYGGLDRRTGRMAHALRLRGVGPEVKIGLCMERSLDLIVGLVAILKAGGAYVPLDPSYPEERLAYMRQDSGVLFVLDRKSLAEADRHSLFEADEPVPAAPVSAGGLAYVIYTSGSTGRPKGTSISHGNVIRLLASTAPLFAFGQRDVWTLFHSHAFDFSVWEIWGALLFGGRLVVVPFLTSRSPQAFRRLLAEENVTVLNQTPSAFRQLAEADLETGGDLALRWVIFGGERLGLDGLAGWFERHGATRPRLVNMYGITETTVHVTWRPLAPADARRAHLSPVGRPLPDLGLYVLSPGGSLCPAGVPGELFVAGAGLGRGYLERPALTAERFLADPFAERPGERLYRSGDLGRYLPGGEVDFLGRADDQVKVRGFRIEPGEIAAALAEHPAVRRAVVLPRAAAGGGHELVAYTSPGGVAAGLLVAHLRRRLPDYMVPDCFVSLDEWPLTATGKLDTAALPAPESAPAETAEVSEGAAATAPRSPLEVRIAEIWQSVLGRRGFGVHDDFFALGGHSLKVTRAVHRIRRQLGVEIAVREFFAGPTVAELAALAAGRRRRELAPIPRLPDAPDYALSHAQRRLWILARIDRDSVVYNVPGAVELRGPLDARALDRALAALQERHESLRTTFRTVDGEPRQVVRPAGDLRLARVDLRALAAPAAAASDIARRDAATPFDLENGPLARAKLLELGDRLRIFFFNVHHIVSDGWSLGVLVRELLGSYAAFAEGREPGRPPLAIQYRDYAAWQNAWLDGGGDDGRVAAERAYWHRQLGGELPRLDLPADHPRPPVKTYRGRALSGELDAGLTARLGALCRARGVSLFMLLAAAVKALLHRYSGERDVIVGSPVAGRVHEGLEGQLGFYVNTLALRDAVLPGETFSALLARVRETVLGAVDHQTYPFDRLVNELRVRRDPARSPVFDVMVAFQNQERPSFDLAGVAVREFEVETGSSRFDLTWIFYEDRARLRFLVEYSTDLFTAARVRRAVGHLRHLLRAAARDPERRVGELPLLAAAERHAVLVEANDTRMSYPRDLPIHSVLAAQTARCPDRVAVELGEERVTFAELDRRANRIACRLRRLGVGPEDPVAVLVERSVEMVAGFLAVLKTGGAYVPMDPTYPEARLRLMLGDVEARVVLTQKRHARRLPAGPAVLLLDDRPETVADADPGVDVAAEQVAYVMYTSGSTGRPKGVRVTHRGLVRLVVGTVYSERRSALQLASISFDASALEIWTALVNGARLVVFPPHLPSLAELAAFIRDRSIANVFVTPALFQPLVADFLEDLRSVGTLVTGGDVMPAAEARRAAREPGCRVLNLYGPTEGAVAVTARRVDPGAPSPVPIGRAIANTRLYVVDGVLGPVPLGVPGELLIGGDCVARDYFERRALTATRFLPDPYGEQPGARLYRTGDAVRAAPGGELEFLGRIDRQVKVRGVRVEPGEIEMVLAEHPRLLQVAVVARDEAGAGRSAAGKQLVAYATSAGPPPAAGELRSFLGNRLPAAMVPSHFVILDRLPVTPSGKVDRAALPAPAAPPPGREALRAPESELERRVAKIWQEVLGIGEVSLNENFFDLGGHSLALIQAHDKLSRALAAEVPMVKLFEYPTVASLCEYLEGTGAVSPTADEGRDRAAARRQARARRRRPMAAEG